MTFISMHINYFSWLVPNATEKNIFCRIYFIWKDIASFIPEFTLHPRLSYDPIGIDHSCTSSRALIIVFPISDLGRIPTMLFCLFELFKNSSTSFFSIVALHYFNQPSFINCFRFPLHSGHKWYFPTLHPAFLAICIIFPFVQSVPLVMQSLHASHTISVQKAISVTPVSV